MSWGFGDDEKKDSSWGWSIDPSASKPRDNFAFSMDAQKNWGEHVVQNSAYAPNYQAYGSGNSAPVSAPWDSWTPIPKDKPDQGLWDPPPLRSPNGMPSLHHPNGIQTGPRTHTVVVYSSGPPPAPRLTRPVNHGAIGTYRQQGAAPSSGHQPHNYAPQPSFNPMKRR